MSPLAQAQLAIMDVARKQYADRYADMLDEMELAKALCKESGHDPDDVLFGNVGHPLMPHPLMTGAKGHAVLNQDSIRPAWVFYLVDAAVAVNVFRRNREAFIKLANKQDQIEKVA